jgi:hypothetical protein
MALGFQALTLQNQVVVGVFKDVESILIENNELKNKKL